MKKKVFALMTTAAMLLGMFPVALAEEGWHVTVPDDAVAVYTAEELRDRMENEEAEILYIMADMTLDLSVTDGETGEVTAGSLVSDDQIISGFTGREEPCVYTLTVTGGKLTASYAQVTVRSYDEVMAYENGEGAIAATEGLAYILDGTMSVEEDTELNCGELGITNAGYVELAAGTRLICNRGIYNTFPDEREDLWIPLAEKHSGAADVLSKGEDSQRVLYADMETLEAYIGEQTSETIDMILLCNTEGKSSYIKLNFDLPYAGLIQSYKPLEIGAGVTVQAESLFVMGDCIWYPSSIIQVQDGTVTGRYPHLVVNPTVPDEDGLLVEREKDVFAGGYRFGQPGEEVVDAFYAMYYDGGRWVTEPVPADQLQADGSCRVEDRSAEARDEGLKHYAAYAMTEWNTQGAIYVEGVGGFDRLEYYVSCYLGTVNFFHEPRYDEDVYLAWADVSALSGRTFYAASYLPEENLDPEWVLLDEEGNELLADAGRVMSIHLVEEESNDDQTVWEIHVPAETIRDYPDGAVLAIRGTAVYEDGSEEGLDTGLYLEPRQALGWTQEDLDQHELSVSEFGLLTDCAQVPVGGSATGYLYMAYYDSESGVWRADRYFNDDERTWFVPQGALSVVGNEDCSSTIFAGAAGSGDSWVYWTNGHMDDEGNWLPNEDIDYGTQALRVEVLGGGECAAFYEDGNFDAYQLSELPMSPLMDTEFYFGVQPEEGVELTDLEVHGVDHMTVSTLNDVEGMYHLCISAADSREFGHDGVKVEAVITLSDEESTWKEIYTLELHNRNTIGWLECAEVPETISLDQLTDVVTMGPEEEMTGVVCFVYYDEGQWHADPYSGDYLWIDSEEPFFVSDAGNGLTTIACRGAGVKSLWWTNHAFDENGAVIGPNDGPDFDASFPLRLVSTKPYLSFRWLGNDGQGYYEQGEPETGYRITPLDRYGHIYYLNWFDEETMNWNQTPVLPELDVEESVPADCVDITPVDPEEIREDQENGAYFVWVTPDESLWNNGFGLKASLDGEELTGYMGVDVRRHKGGFYSVEEKSNDTFVTEWIAGSERTNYLYFGVEEYENEGFLVDFFPMSGWDENGQPIEGSDVYQLWTLEDRDDMVLIELNPDAIPEDGVWIEVGMRLADDDGVTDPEHYEGNLWTESYGIYVSVGEASGFCLSGKDGYIPLEDGSSNPLLVLEDSELYFRAAQYGREAQVSWDGAEDLEIEQQEDGTYKIVVPQSVARSVGYEGRNVTATVAYNDAWEEKYTIHLHAYNAMAWGWGEDGMIHITDDNHGLSHAVYVREGEQVTGTAYYVWYNEETSLWQADAYSNDYLVLEGDESFRMCPVEENVTGGQTTLECVGQGTSCIYWTNHNFDEDGNVTGPADQVDRDLFELVLISEEGYHGQLYAWDEVCEDALCSRMDVSPLCGGVAYLGFPDESLSVQSVTFSGLEAEIRGLENGMYEIRVSPDAARSCKPTGMITATVAFEDEDGNAWEEEIPIEVAACNALGWYNEEIHQQIVLEDDDHGLSDRVILAPDERITGMVCFVYYHDEMDCWVADPYGGDYLRLEGDESVVMENQPSDENDDYNYDDATVITCVGGGESCLWWTNHAVNEDGEVIGPNDHTDYDSWPLVFCSTQPCLSMSWVNRDGEGNWWEDGNRSTGCFITPNHSAHDHIFYLNWLDEEGLWCRQQVIPTVESVISDDGEDTALDNSLVSLQQVTDSGLDNHVRLSVSGWDMIFTLSASLEVGDETIAASKQFHVCLPNEGFYRAPEISKENYIASFTPVWGEENAFWFGYNDPNNTVTDVDVCNDGVRVDPVEGAEGRLFKITLEELTEHGRDVALEVTTASGHSFGMGIWVDGVTDQSDYLGHRGLTNHGDGWQINWEDEVYRSVGRVVPGSDEWLIFYYVPFDGEPQPVEVEVTLGSEFVTLEKVTDLERTEIHPGAEDADYFYRIRAKEGNWGEEVTLSATVGETTVSDTFVLERGHSAFFADDDPDLEGYSDFLYNFTLLPDGPAEFYLHLQPEEGWSVEEICTDWYSEKDDTHYPLNGTETLASLEPVEGWEHLYRLVLDPTLVRRHYWNEDYHLELQIIYRDPDGNRHNWGCGFPIMNRLPYLTYGDVEWNGEQLYVRERRESFLRINPWQERFQVYFLNTYDPETDKWTETPVHAQAICVDEGDTFVTVKPYEGDQPANDLVAEYGCLVTVRDDSWGRPFAMQGADEQGNTGHLRAEVARGELNYYSSPNLNDDTFIDFFRLSDLSDGNVLYVGGEFEENAGHWIREVRTDGWTREDGEQRDCANADLVTVTRTTSRAYKVVIDREKAQSRFGRDGFNLTLNVVLEDGDGNVWDNPVEIWVENNLPFLAFKWLENENGAWYVPTERNLEDGFSILPGDEFWHIYGLGYYDRFGNLTIEGVVPTVSGSAITVEKLTDLGENIAEDQTYGEQFVRLTAGEGTWDQKVTFTGTGSGRTASMQAFVGRGEAEFYTSAAIGNETCIREFAKDPVNGENNVIYLGIYKDPEWNMTLADVALQDDSLATLTDLGMDESGSYYLFKVKLAEAVSANDRSFDLRVDYRWIDAEDATESRHHGCGIWVYPGSAEGHAATVQVDQQEVMFYTVDDGPAVPYVWHYDETLEYSVLRKADNLNLTYDPETNTLTLNGAELGSLYVDTRLEPGGETDDLTLELVGENSIFGGRRCAALTFEGGLDVTITSREEASLTVSSINDLADPWSHPALDLWGNRDCGLTISGKASVTLSVGGEAYEVDENGEPCLDNGEAVPAHLNTVGVNEQNRASLTVKDSATLTTVAPDDPLARWSGLNDFALVEVADSATINTERLELYREDAKLQILGGTLNVTMRGDDNGEDDWYFGGLAVHDGDLTIKNGTVNVTAPAFDMGGTPLYTNAVVVNGGTFAMTGGQLKMDLTGFAAGDIRLLDGVGLRVGDNEADNTARFEQTGGAIRFVGGIGQFAGMEVCANAVAELTGGTVDSQAWQGVVNNGIMNVRGDMAIALNPWTDGEGVMHASSEGGMFRNDLHYVMRQTSALNLYGGRLTITACDGHALVSQSEYLQTAGTVKLKSIQQDESRGYGAAAFSGRNSLTGGSLTVDGLMGVQLYPEEYMTQNYFRLAGGSMTINSIYSGMTATLPVSLQGGSLVITQDEAGAETGASALVIFNGGTLSVTGGEHRISSFVKEGGLSMGLQTYDSGAVKFLGGTTQIRGNRAVVLNSTEEHSNPIQLGDGMYLATNTGGTGLDYTPDEWTDEDGENSWPVYANVLTEQLNGETVLCTDVTVAPGSAPVIQTTAHMEVTTARPSVGALVTVQATVTTANGKASFDLEGLELAGGDSGSITVNGVTYTGGLSDIPVEGSALIVFRVKPLAEGTASVTCTAEDAGGTRAEDAVSFPVYGFRMSAPTYTTYEQITVRGTAAPGQVITLTVTGGQPVEVTVTELGTFAAQIDLPVEEENYDAQSFSIVAEMDSKQVGETLSVVYNPTSVRLDYLRITNEITDNMGNPIRSTNTVSYLSGTGMPERSFYTYVPDMNRFEFETEFFVPTGWIITEAKVVVSYQQENMEEKYTNLILHEDTARQQIHEDDLSRTEFWVWDSEEDLPAAPIDFKVVYRVARVKDTIIPSPDDPEDPDDYTDEYVEEEEERITDTIPLVPIIDPSGIIYSGTLDNPIAGATVTLYYGGDGQQVGEEQLFDMTPYNQTNPQITDENGRYGWNVPTGWWKVVAEKNGFRAESQWVHVLPQHTDLHLNLNMPSGKSGSYDLSAIRPLSINGKIPNGNFEAAVTVTNFSAREDALLVVATYTAQGQYQSVQYIPVSGLERGVTTTVTVDIANADGAVGRMKAFLVSSMEDMTPLSAAVEY